MSDQEKQYWRSLEELSQKSKSSPEFLSSPLREEAAEDGNNESRRDFLKLMGASFAMLTASACTRRPVEKIIPYLKKPEEITPGVANWYASTCAECDTACGVLVKTREGRPIKFEGNPAHPISQGGLCARGQASVLNVYDPDRLRSPMASDRKGVFTDLDWSGADRKVVEKLRQVRSRGGRIRILTGEIHSSSTQALIREFQNGFSNSGHVVFEPLSCEEVAVASELSYGNRVVPRYRFERAEAIVSFGADFLGAWHSPVEFARGFSKNRKVGKLREIQNSDSRGAMSRFVAFESRMTLTGSNADERHRVRSGDEVKAALALAHELIVSQGKSKYARDTEVLNFLRGYSAVTVSSQLNIPLEVFRKLARELWDLRGKSLVLGGGQDTKGDHGVALEIVVNLLNSALENEGSTVDGILSPITEYSSYAGLTKLIEEMKAGQVDVLLVYNVNPAYSFPSSLGFEKALGKVPFVATFSMHADETAQRSDLVLALSHSTETWGDRCPQKGFYSVQQPTISPLYSTRSFEEALMAWAKQLGFSGNISSQSSWHEYVKNQWKQTIYREYGISSPFPLFWDSVLRQGFYDGLAARGDRDQANTRVRDFLAAALRSMPEVKSNDASEFKLVLYPTVGLYDGRNANNGWLQELPDPVTKVTWDNYACVSTQTAKQLGVKNGDVLRLKVADQTTELPAYVQPGMHDKTIAVAVGYGREKAGRVGTGVGRNAFALALAGKQTLALSSLTVSVEKTSEHHPLAATQQHHSMEGRKIVREATYSEFKKNPAAGNEEHEHDMTLWPKYEYAGYRWAMSIDLSSCTGCSACVVACQAENNIPVVGKPFVMSSREMHWLRIDRYYSGGPENPETVHQPMLCQHCENAPCETVCPVLATLHDGDGLNQQVYNRCVGTRYCANNCPYKVRRFNWFTFTDVAKPMNLVYNPDITVRTRGVMEKCTFCMQRIREAKDRAKDFDTQVKDGDLKTACQQSCPTQAITFGNINDDKSQVAQLAKDSRGYRVLAELNTRPSITYLTKIRNKA